MERDLSLVTLVISTSISTAKLIFFMSPVGCPLYFFPDQDRHSFTDGTAKIVILALPPAFIQPAAGPPFQLSLIHFRSVGS